ncbi:hypothetical protein H5410_014000 [Solanum commersonii]|uniref:Uncharacterized protein n=1 Tax=Solanum commersonii TaxID=4109 RepID=A0A9J5ZPS7_SOLCO|nr:hypothetical protein H5410_014000 [Solanum commersonii]
MVGSNDGTTLCKSDLRSHRKDEWNYANQIKESPKRHDAMQLRYEKSPEGWHGATHIGYEKVVTRMMAWCYTNQIKNKWTLPKVDSDPVVVKSTNNCKKSDMLDLMIHATKSEFVYTSHGSAAIANQPRTIYRTTHDLAVVRIRWYEFVDSVLSRVVSDHSPLLLQCGDWGQSNSYFKFENWCLHTEGFNAKVKDW